MWVNGMTDEEKIRKRLRQAIEEDMTENELFEITRERRYRINDLEKEKCELLGIIQGKDEVIAELEKENKLSEEIIIGEQQEINRLEKENKSLGERVLQLEKDKGKLTDENKKLRCCGNCKHDIKPTTKESILFCCECKKLDETKDNIILTKWEKAE